MDNPGDLLLVAKLDDMRDEDGALDPVKADVVIDAVLSDRDHWALCRILVP